MLDFGCMKRRRLGCFHVSTILIVFTLLMSESLMIETTAANPRYAVTDHSDGERFHNLEEGGDKGLFDLLRWQTTRLFGTRRVWSAYRDYSSDTRPH